LAKGSTRRTENPSPKSRRRGSIVISSNDCGGPSALGSAAGCQLILVPPAIDQKNELDRTAALLSALDAMASAPTAVSWLAAAAGIFTCKILYDTSWTSFGCTYEPFAPSALYVMPRARGDWADAFGQAEALIKSRFASP